MDWSLSSESLSLTEVAHLNLIIPPNYHIIFGWPSLFVSIFWGFSWPSLVYSLPQWSLVICSTLACLLSWSSCQVELPMALMGLWDANQSFSIYNFEGILRTRGSHVNDLHDSYCNVFLMCHRSPSSDAHIHCNTSIGICQSSRTNNLLLTQNFCESRSSPVFFAKAH